MHYGNTVKVAAIKKQQIEKTIQDNDNRMKTYVAMLQKNKSELKFNQDDVTKELTPVKPEFSNDDVKNSGLTANEKSSHLPKLDKEQIFSRINADLGTINIDTKEYISNDGTNTVLDSSFQNNQQTPELSQDAATNTQGLPAIANSDESAQKNEENNFAIPELSVANKSILEK